MMVLEWTMAIRFHLAAKPAHQQPTKFFVEKGFHCFMLSIANFAFLQYMPIGIIVIAMKRPFRFVDLFLATVALVMLMPLLERNFFGGIVMNLIFLGLVATAIRSLARSRKVRIVAVVSGGIAVVVDVSFTWLPMPEYLLPLHTTIFSLGYGVLVSLTIWVIVRHLLSAKRIGIDEVIGGAAGYLLLGLLWAFIYLTLEVARPDSLSFPLKIKDPENFSRLLYFSYTTLTTLGYGDLLPKSPMARMLATLEALTGQIYLAILIARLVGIHIAEHIRKGSHHR